MATSGSSVALAGSDTLVGVARTGIVHIFAYKSNNWTLSQTLSGEDTGSIRLANNNYFGSAVSLDGNTLAVGVYSSDGASGCNNCGAVYIFTRSGGAWNLQQEISDDSLVTGFTSATLSGGDYFGWSVALAGNTLAVGAYKDNGSRGAVYVFTRSGSGWSLQDEISSTDHSDNTGFDSSTLSSSDYFGHSVALDSNTLAVGAYGDNASGCTDCGAVYIFTRSGGAWSLQKKIADDSTVTGFTGSTLSSYDYFGYSVALSGSTLAVGAYRD